MDDTSFTEGGFEMDNRLRKLLSKTHMSLIKRVSSKLKISLRWVTVEPGPKPVIVRIVVKWGIVTVVLQWFI